MGASFSIQEGLGFKPGLRNPYPGIQFISLIGVRKVKGFDFYFLMSLILLRLLSGGILI